MSDLEAEIRKLAGDYIRGEVSIVDLRDKQVTLMSRALETKDSVALDIADEMELMLAEVDTGERTEAQLRDGLRFLAYSVVLAIPKMDGPMTVAATNEAYFQDWGAQARRPSFVVRAISMEPESVVSHQG